MEYRSRKQKQSDNSNSEANPGEPTYEPSVSSSRSSDNTPSPETKSQVGVTKSNPAQSESQKKDNKPALLSIILAVFLIVVGVMYANWMRPPNAVEDTAQTATKAYLDTVTKRLNAIENHINKITTNEEMVWESGINQELTQTWCANFPGTQVSYVNCHSGVGVSVRSGVVQKIVLEKQPSKEYSISFKNVSRNYSFSYSEPGTFGLSIRNIDMRNIVTSRLSFGLRAEGLRLNMMNVAVGTTQETAFEELMLYMKSPESLKEHSLQRLEKLRERAKTKIKWGSIRKFVDCKEVYFQHSIGRVCKTALLSSDDKRVLLDNFNSQIDETILGVNEHYEYIYSVLQKASFNSECPSCWE